MARLAVLHQETQTYGQIRFLTSGEIMLVSNETAKASLRDVRITQEGPGPSLGSCVGLLGQLSNACRNDLLAHGTHVSIVRRQILFERNLRLRFAYFVESGAVSLFAKAGTDQRNVEIRTLGAGDFVGIPLILGAQVSPHRCTVQVPGKALRIDADDLVLLVEAYPELRNLLLAYVHAALVHSSQLVACNTMHTLRERLARWLLVASDRLQMNDVPLTHDVLSRAIAVRRAGVTTEIGRMEQAGLIRKHRGSISILDRRGLENASCSCYQVLRIAGTRAVVGSPKGRQRSLCQTLRNSH